MRSIIGVYVGAILIAILLPIPVLLRLPLILLLAVELKRRWQKASTMDPVEARLDEDGYWQWSGDTHRYRVIHARRDPFAVRMTIEGSQRPFILIMRDAVDAGTYHALCCRIAQHHLPKPQTHS